MIRDLLHGGIKRDEVVSGYIVDAMKATFGEGKVKLDLWPTSLLGLTLAYRVDGSISVGVRLGV